MEKFPPPYFYNFQLTAWLRASTAVIRSFSFSGSNDINGGTQAVMTLSYSAPYVYTVKDSETDVRVLIDTNKNLFENAPRFAKSSNVYSSSITAIDRKKNPVLVEFEWPNGYKSIGKYSKYYIFYEEIRGSNE